MPLIYDQLNRPVQLTELPKRIISLVPSQTELLADLQLDREVVGITKFCVHPEHWFRSKQRVGGTKKINIETINSLQPHLVIANKEENTKSEIEFLCEHYPVYISDINDLSSALLMIKDVGEITGREQPAQNLAQQIQTGFSELHSDLAPNKKSVLYLIWKDPYMAAGKTTFIDDMLAYCGLANVLQADRYPALQPEVIKTLAPDIIFLSSEPYPFNEKHVSELQDHFPSSQIKLVDGEMFSWYGSRLKYAPRYFKKILKNIRAD